MTGAGAVAADGLAGAAVGAVELLVMATGLVMAAVPPPPPTVVAVVSAGADAGGKDSGVLRGTPVQPSVPDDAAAVATDGVVVVVRLFPVDAVATFIGRAVAALEGIVVFVGAAAVAATTGLETAAGWASIDGLGGCSLGSVDCGGRTVGGWLVVAFVAAAVVEGAAAVFAALDAGALAVAVFSTGTAAVVVDDDAVGADISM
jgi:hypothetical protein